MGRLIVSPGAHAHCAYQGKDNCWIRRAGSTTGIRNSKILRFAGIRYPITSHGWMLLVRSLSCSLFILYQPTERPCQSRQCDIRDETVYFDDYVTIFYDETDVRRSPSRTRRIASCWRVQY